MRSLTENQIDRQRGFLIITGQQAKEKRAKIISLTVEDLEIVRALPLAFSPDMPFFRHERNIKGGTKTGDGLGHNSIYRAWRRACDRLGVQGVSLYPGTKHSTAMGLREVLSPEQIRDISGHSTKSAFERYCRADGE